MRREVAVYWKMKRSPYPVMISAIIMSRGLMISNRPWTFAKSYGASCGTSRATWSGIIRTVTVLGTAELVAGLKLIGPS